MLEENLRVTILSNWVIIMSVLTKHMDTTIDDCKFKLSIKASIVNIAAYLTQQLTSESKIHNLTIVCVLFRKRHTWIGSQSSMVKGC